MEFLCANPLNLKYDVGNFVYTFLYELFFFFFFYDKCNKLWTVGSRAWVMGRSSGLQVKQRVSRFHFCSCIRLLFVRARASFALCLSPYILQNCLFRPHAKSRSHSALHTVGHFMSRLASGL